MSMDSINSILSEEGSVTSIASSQGELDGGGGVVKLNGGGGQQQAASLSLSCLLDSVPPPSNTPDSMARESPRPPPTVNAAVGSAHASGASTMDSPVTRGNSNSSSSSNNASGGSLFEQGLRLVKMGTKFKQQIEEIEAAKKRKQQQQQQQQQGNSNNSCDTNTTPPGAQVVGLAQLPTTIVTKSDEEVKQNIYNFCKNRLTINYRDKDERGGGHRPSPLLSLPQLCHVTHSYTQFGL